MANSNEQPDPWSHSGNDGGQDRTRLTTGQNMDLPEARGGETKLAAGTLVGGDYEVLGLLGVGGMGYVYRVRHKHLGKIYAMKTISPDQLNDLSWKRLTVEAQAMARINHPNIVGIANLGMHEGRLPFYVMDLLVGENLADIIDKNGPLPLKEALPIFLEIANGLGYAHRKGIVHRDIKPGNIFILNEPDQTGARVKLVDFGIAKLSGLRSQSEQALTNMGEVFGSPLYMSPEQCVGSRIDARSDIYSLGCTFFEVLTGQTPFKGKSPVQTMLMHQEKEAPSLAQVSGKSFPESIETIIATMLAKRPMDRYPNLEKVAEDLLRANRGEELPASPFARTIRLNVEEDDTSAQKELKLKQSRLVKILAATAVLSVFIVAGICMFDTSKLVQKHTSFVPPIAVSGPEPEKDKASQSPDSPGDNIAIGSFSKHEQTQKDRQIIEFNFPEGISLGRLKVNHNGRESEYEASGNKTIPADSKIELVASRAVMANLSLLRGFGNNDLTEITINFPDDVTNLKSLTEGPELKSTSHPISEILPCISHMKRIKSLCVEGSAINRSAESLAALKILDSFPRLRKIDFNASNVTGKDLAQLECIKRMESISLNQADAVAPLVQALAGNDKIERFCAEGMAPPGLNASDMKVLGNLKALRSLDIAYCELSDQALTALYPAKSLQKMELSVSSLNPRVTAALMKLTNLKYLHLHVGSHLPDEKTAVDKLKTQIATVNIEGPIGEQYRE